MFQQVIKLWVFWMQAIIICTVLRNATTIHGIGYLQLQFSQTPNLALFYGWRVSGAYTGPPAGFVFPYGRLCPCLPPDKPPRSSSSRLSLLSRAPPRPELPAPTQIPRAGTRIPRRRPHPSPLLDAATGMSTLQFRGAAAAGCTSSPTESGQMSDLCPICQVQLIRIRSKKRETYGQIFVKCPYCVKVTDFG